MDDSSKVAVLMVEPEFAGRYPHFKPISSKVLRTTLHHPLSAIHESTVNSAEECTICTPASL